MLGLLPWLIYFMNVRSLGYPQFVILPLYALYPGPLHTVWTRAPEVYAIGITVAAVLLLLGLGGLILRPKRLAFVAAVTTEDAVKVAVSPGPTATFPPVGAGKDPVAILGTS